MARLPSLLGGLLLTLAGPTGLLATTVTLSPVSDAYVNDSDPAGTYNNAWLVAGRSPAEFTPRYRSFLRFDGSGIPSNAIVSSALLRLNLQAYESTSPATIGVRRVLASWSSGTLTWNNQPAFSSAPSASTAVGTAIGADYPWTVTGLVQDWVEGQFANYGLALVVTNETTAAATRTFASLNHTNTALRPELVVTYALPADIAVTPPMLAFGNQLVSTTSAVQNVTFLNSGGSTLWISNVTSSSSQFRIEGTPPFPASFSPGSSGMFQVRFAPTSVGAKSGTVSIASNDPDEASVSVPCTGTGVAPDINLVPTSLAFGNQLVGSQSSTQTVTIQNTGSADLHVNSLSNSSSQFLLILGASLPATIVPGGSLPFGVRFAPTSVGAKSGGVTVLSDDPDEGTRTVSCTGTGVVPDIDLVPTALNFGNQLVGSQSSTQTVTIQNTGSADLHVSAISSSSSQFLLILGASLPATIVPGGSLPFGVRFAPTSVGAKSGSVTVLSDDPDESTRTVSCTGTGVVPDIDLVPTALAFGNQLVGSQSVTQTVTIQNTGSADLHVNSISSSSSQFLLILGTSLPATIVPGGSLPFGVRFAPTSVDAKSGSATVLSDDPDEGTRTVSCTGTGVVPDIDVVPTALNFDNQLLGTTSTPQMVTIQNTGSADLHVTGINSSSGEFAVGITVSLPATIAPGGSLPFGVRFAPTSVGAKSGSVTVLSDDPDESTRTVSCTGTGVVPDIELVPTALNFGNQLLGTTSSPQTVTIQNTGSADLHLASLQTTNSEFMVSLGASLPATIIPGGSLPVQVRFAPTNPGLRNIRIAALSDDPDEPSRELICTGLGLPELSRSTFYDGSPGASARFTRLSGLGSNIAMTVEAWVRREDPSRTEAILSHNRSNSFWFGFAGPRLRFYRSGGQYADSIGTVEGQRWTHVAAAYDGSRVDFFIDGRPAGVNLLGHSGASQADTVQLAGDEQGANFRGFLDEVRLWHHSRSEQQIRDAMFDPAGPMRGLLALFPSGGLWEAIGGIPGQAGPGVFGREISILREPLHIPRSLWEMAVDGQADPGIEYLGAAQIVIRYDDGPDAVAYLVHDGEAGNGNLYVAITGLRDVPPGRDRALSWVAVGLDPRGSQSELATPFQFHFRGFLSGGQGQMFNGDGQGGFNYYDVPPGPNQEWDAAYDRPFEFGPPTMEFRIPKSEDWLWRDTNGLMIGHFDVAAAFDNYLAPNGTRWNSPATWPTATYVENSVIPPVVIVGGHVYDRDAAHPIAIHRVFLQDAQTGVTFATRRTGVDGSFRFDTTVPPNRPVAVVIESCADCRYADPQVDGEGLQPSERLPQRVTFAGVDEGTNQFQSIQFYVLPTGPITLTDYRPRAVPAEPLVPGDPAARVKLFGANLHDRIQVYLYGCLDLHRQNGPSVPLGCIEGEDYFEARIVSRTGDESWVEVEVPPVPLAHRNPSGWWGWAVRDNWDRPARAGAMWTRVGGASDNHFDFRVARVGGARPLLVILVDYNDRTFSNANYYANYAGRIFGPAEPNVTAYYRQTSDGLFTYLPATAGDQDGTADGLVMVRMSVSQSDAPSGSEYRSQVLALADPVLDYSRYDADGNGRIEDRELGVLVIQANGGPLGKTARADAVSGDGVELGGLGVAVISENAPNYVLYHELAHLVELHGVTRYDLYNTRDAFLQTVIAWDLDDQGAITRRDQVGGEIALELDADGVGAGGAVAAYRDQNGELSLAAYDLSDPADPRKKGLARAGLASDLSICQASPTRVLTALQSGGGNLKLIVWDLNADLEFTRRGDYTPEPATDIDVTAVSSSRVVVAFRNADGNLKLMVVNISDGGELELADSFTAGGATEINLVNLGATRVVTAVRLPDSGNLKLICFDLAADGGLARRGDYQAGLSQDIDLAAVDQRRVAASVRTASDKCKVMLFEVDAAGDFTRPGSYEDEDGEMVKETRDSIPGEIYPSQPMTSVGAVGARIVFAYVRTNHLMRLRTLNIQGDGGLSLAGTAETVGSMRSGKIVRLNSSRLATISRNDGTIWTGARFGLLGDNTGNRVVHFDPCTKLKLGWLPHASALASGTYELSPMGTEGAQALIVRNPCHRETEYFIVEVRTQDSLYESGLADQGLAIWHIDEAKVYPEPFVSLEWLGGSANTALWAATDTALTAYDDSSAPAGSRWSDFTPSGISIRDVTAVGDRISFQVSVPLCLDVVRILHTAGGPMRIEFSGNPGRVYHVEVSNDLKSWTTLVSVTADARGRAEYVDNLAVFEPVRFYRVVAP